MKNFTDGNRSHILFFARKKMELIRFLDLGGAIRLRGNPMGIRDDLWEKTEGK